MTKQMSILLIVLGAAVAVFGILALTGGDDEVTVTGVWARSSMMVDGAAAAYMELNGGAVDDELVGATVPATIADRAELHETQMSGGMASMHEVDSIPVPAGGKVMLEPGGFHVMLLDLASPLEVGQKFDITLEFAEAGEITVEATVQESQ